MAGYAVECALKAYISRQFRADEVPEKTTVNKFYTHSFKDLVAISGVELKTALDLPALADRDFAFNWNMVLDWTNDSRYDHTETKPEAVDMVIAVGDPATGVLHRGASTGEFARPLMNLGQVRWRFHSP